MAIRPQPRRVAETRASSSTSGSCCSRSTASMARWLCGAKSPRGAVVHGADTVQRQARRVGACVVTVVFVELRGEQAPEERRRRDFRPQRIAVRAGRVELCHARATASQLASLKRVSRSSIVVQATRVAQSDPARRGDQAESAPFSCFDTPRAG
jgi:hypothetical protein